MSKEPNASVNYSETKEDYIKKNTKYIKKKSQILSFSYGPNVTSCVRNIDKRAKSFIEETGVNVSYIVFGFIHWKEAVLSEISYRAPILLIPITLNRESSVDPYEMVCYGDEIIINPTFSYKLTAEYGIELREYNEESLADYLGKIRDKVSKLGWTVTEECKVALFSFLKINMYLDLMKNQDKILKNDNVRVLLGESCLGDGSIFSGEFEHTKDPLINLVNVVDADSSQIEAIEMAKAGKSFVLQGPPGTGKSQTITNIIAELLMKGNNR